MSPPRVLVVDDDPRLLKIMRARLTSAGYRVTATQSVAKALDAARADRPDAIVSDVIMDELDGPTSKQPGESWSAESHVRRELIDGAAESRP